MARSNAVGSLDSRPFIDDSLSLVKRIEAIATVIIHATITFDGYLADADGGVDRMFGRPSAPEDDGVVALVMETIGAIVDGVNRRPTIEEGEIPYGGILQVPVYLMTHTATEPVVRDGITYTFVVDDIAGAVEPAKQDAKDGFFSLLDGKISRQCLALGLVDELHLDIAPVLLGGGISLFEGLGQHIELERIQTSAFASEVHLAYRALR
ncbi:dihydrofolate reductase family protein [Glutamicibacter mysorens]|uniref:RibD domain-containing protein n=1 Tax=Glutamicibacter mysorens TaxID=257984 RepID=A0ABX4N3D6_9MICC|nr:dihydrofolate reductase family protein [Glutamicibacter mysorens]PJJ45006.1 RibD domain-containing protein [Glutamicibacter mysorens]UTM46101.1 dihydrofolate reductase family protein [Glutamicibacter mysorens]